MHRDWSSLMARMWCEEYTNIKQTKARTKSGYKLGVCTAHALIPMLARPLYSVDSSSNNSCYSAARVGCLLASFID